MGKRLAVIFPGIGYHCDKPILYYSRKLAKEQEYKEIISLEYSYTEKNIRGNEKQLTFQNMKTYYLFQKV